MRDGAVRTAGYSVGPVRACRWLDGGEGLVWLANGSRKKLGSEGGDSTTGAASMVDVLHVVRFGDEATSLVLPGGFWEWHIFPPRSRNEIALVRKSFEGFANSRSELYTFNPTTGLKRLERVPRISYTAPSLPFGIPVWSPDGRRMILAIPKEGESFREGLRFGAIEVETGALTPIPGHKFWRAGRWIDDERLRTVSWVFRRAELEAATAPREESPSSPEDVQSDLADGTRTDSGTSLKEVLDSVEQLLEGEIRRQGPVVENKIVVQTFNAATGACTTDTIHELAPRETARLLPGAHHALILVEHKADLLTRWSEVSILNLSTGKRIRLPDAEGGFATPGGQFDWNGDHHRLVYRTAPEGTRGKPHLVLADADRGVIARLEVPRRWEMTRIRMSPDGRHVAIYRKPRRGMFFRSASRLEIWNTKTGEVVPVQSFGAVTGARLQLDHSIGLDWPFTSLAWSPEGLALAYPFLRLDGGELVYPVRIADYGTWLRDQK